MQGSLVKSCRCAVLNKVENSTTKTFDGEISRGSVTTFVCPTASLIPSEDQVIQINVSTLYANTAGFTVIVGAGGEKKTCKHPILRGSGQSEGFFAMVMNRCGYI